MTTKFLGNGEIGNLIRSKDWSKHPLGEITQWPASLRTVLSIILNAKFPIIIFWGDDLFCFYNDAYRPSLSHQGKHPGILGESTKHAWTDIWGIIPTIIGQVMSGVDTDRSNGQWIPMNKNGKIGEVNWTFNYSPIIDVVGKVEGVLVTCHESSESEILFRNIANQAPVLIWMAGTDKLCHFFNKAWLDFTGRTMEQEMGNGWVEGVHPEDFQECMEHYIQSFDQRNDFYMEYRLKSHDGEYRWISDKGVPRYNLMGEFEGYVGACMDIHEQVTNQQKITEAEQRLRLALEATNLSTFELNLKTQELLYSSKLLEIFGHGSNKKLTYEDLRFQMLAIDYSEIVEKAFATALVTGKYYYEARILKPNGQIAWIRTQGKIFFSDDNEPNKMLGTVWDITEEKKLQDVLQKSEQKFRLLADSMPQHIWTADVQGNLNYFNQSVFDFSGLSQEQIQKDGWLQIVHPQDRDENAKQWVYSVISGKDFLFEHRFRRHDGEYRWQLSRAIPQKDEYGNIQMWVGTSTDIQDQKNFAQELERQVSDRTLELEQKNKELVNTNTELQSFAYVSSHDLQEPLRKIQTFTSRILEKDFQNLSDAGKDYFKRMSDAANRMQKLIEDLLDYSRTNSSERIYKNTNLYEIVYQVKNDMKETLLEKQAIIEIGKMNKLKVIPFQMRQLMHNLISNSLKFSQKDQIPYIKIDSEIIDGNQVPLDNINDKKQYCHISYSDNGIGFEPQHKDRIFEVFQRLHRREQYEGTGIGLAIVKKIVENHEGAIAASGEPNKGAKFEIYLPA